MTDRALLLAALLEDPAKAAEVPAADGIALLIEMARVARALELLSVPQKLPRVTMIAPSAMRILTIKEAAERSRKSVRWLRDHWRTEMPFAVRKGRSVLFPEEPFERWLKRT